MDEVRSISVEEAGPLRQRILRPHQAVEEMVFDGDRSVGAGHFGLFRDGEMVGVASVLPLRRPDSIGESPWRMRLVGVVEELRGQGLGASLVRACEAHVTTQGGDELWLSARVAVEDFYRLLGYETVTPAYDKPGVGPHVDMVKMPS